MTPVAPAAPWQTAWPVLPALLLLLAGLWGVRKEIRPSVALWGILGVALLVRVIWMPLGLHVYDGHEAEYYDIYRGVRPLSRGGPLLYPAMQWFYAALGARPRHGAVPILVNVLFSLVAIGATAGWLGRVARPSLGLVAALALALWGNHAFWSSSAYNVMLPHALGMTCLWALSLLSRGDCARAAGMLAGGAGALAVATRLESVVLAPVALGLILQIRPAQLRRWLPGLVAGVGLSVLAALLVVGHGQLPGADQRGLSFGINLGLLAYWAPLDQWPLLVLPGLGMLLGLRRWPWLFAGLLAWVVGAHVFFATFDDYGFRHVVLALPGVAAALGALVCARWGVFPLAAGVVLILGHTADVASRYYLAEEGLEERLPADLPRIGLDDLPDCSLICEDGRVLPEESQRSHFNLWDPAEEVALREEKGCILWLWGIQEERWSSRSVRDRSLRLEHLFLTRPVAVVTDPALGYVGVAVEVGPRAGTQRP